MAAVRDPRLTLSREQIEALAPTMGVPRDRLAFSLVPIFKRVVNALVRYKPLRGENWFKYKINAKWAATNAPDYLDKIACPMDLRRMHEKTSTTDPDDMYADLPEFERDMRLIAENAKAYNGEGHAVAQAAADLVQHFYEAHWDAMSAEAAEVVREEQLKELQRTLDQLRLQQAMAGQAAAGQ